MSKNIKVQILSNHAASPNVTEQNVPINGRSDKIIAEFQANSDNKVVGDTIWAPNTFQGAVLVVSDPQGTNHNVPSNGSQLKVSNSPIDLSQWTIGASQS